MKALAAALWGLLVALCLAAPLSEFGRHIGFEVLVSIANSSIVGIAVTAAAALIAVAAALAQVRFRNEWATSSSSVVADTLDAVPAVLWVLALVVAVDEPRRLVAPCALILLAAPAAIRVFGGECRRQADLPYILAARAIGVSSSRLFFRHMLPNSRSVIIPFLLQTFGGAIAIDGAVGVLGAGNRSDLNLGTLLLRGKEQVLLSPWLLVLSLLAYLAVFAVLFVAEDRASDRGDGGER